MNYKIIVNKEDYITIEVNGNIDSIRDLDDIKHIVKRLMEVD